MKPIRHIVLGRFAPIHDGHVRLISTLIENYSLANSGIIIGSSNVCLNPRTPFSFEERKSFVKRIFPQILVWDIPDVEENLSVQRDETLAMWQNNLKEMESLSGETWIFCGGSQEDLKDYEKDFQTEVLVDRSMGEEKISGTHIRKLLSENNFIEVKKYLPAIVFDEIIEKYSHNSELF